jgi:hypothetical protein
MLIPVLICKILISDVTDNGGNGVIGLAVIICGKILIIVVTHQIVSVNHLAQIVQVAFVVLTSVPQVRQNVMEIMSNTVAIMMLTAV